MKVKITSPGKKTLEFNKGGLHSSTDTPQDQPIPVAKVSAAASGSLGAKAKKQALFMKNVLTGGK